MYIEGHKLYFLIMKIKFRFWALIISFLFLGYPSHHSYGEEKNTGVNFYTGTFDFSDDGKRSSLVGFEHQNENLYRETVFGKVSPITGAMITADNAGYIYTGFEINYSLGPINLTPSFAPGYYKQGDGKDLGYPLEFKSEVQLSLDLGETTNFGMSYNHVSNASLGDKNPGANSYWINLLKKF